VAISTALYAGAILLGFVTDFRLTLFSLLAIQVTWTLFCAFRAIQLRFRGANRAEAEAYERADYAFARGGSLSSITLFLAVVVFTQIV
jgi:hypothetical protein